jgi:hypothetical protein
MTALDTWKKRFDHYRGIRAMIEDTISNHPNVKSIISAGFDDNGKHYNFALEDKDGDAFAGELLKILQIVREAEALLSPEEIEAANQYKKLKDGTNALENWKEQFDFSRSAIKGFEQQRSRLTEVENLEPGSAPNDYIRFLLSFPEAVTEQVSW